MYVTFAFPILNLFLLRTYGDEKTTTHTTELYGVYDKPLQGSYETVSITECLRVLNVAHLFVSTRFDEVHLGSRFLARCG